VRSALSAAAGAAPPALDRAVRAPGARSVDAESQGAIDEVVSRFERALESRDLAVLRSVYPAITPAQRNEWSAFFRNAASVRADFSSNEARLTSTGADVAVIGSLRFTDRTTRAPVEQMVTFRTSLRRGPGGWTMRSLQ
jgi:hypothetical protein